MSKFDGPKFSPWFIRDTDYNWSDKGFWVKYSIKLFDDMEIEKESTFIAAIGKQAEYEVKMYEKIKVFAVRFKWYCLVDVDWKSLMRVPEYVELELQKKKEKKSNRKLVAGQLSLEDYDSMNRNIRINCPHRSWNVKQETDFETCIKCRKRKCLSCKKDLSNLSGDEMLEHFAVSAIDLKSFILHSISLKSFICQDEKLTAEKNEPIQEIQIQGLEIFEEEN